MELSIIIPYHNEGEEFISSTLFSIKETIDIDCYEIIVVDDGSKKPLSLKNKSLQDVKIFRHTENKGVGSAFDTGVEKSTSENIFLMGSDIRFLKNQWASKMLTEIKHNPKSFICTSCININKDNMDIKSRKSVGMCNGATILMFHDKQTNPTVSETFRGIIEAKWLPFLKDRDVPAMEIPCILGAAYGVSKSWYKYVDGWAGHKLWGTLEPYISLKSWFFGGNCLCAPRIETAHIFKQYGTHETPQDIVMYNKMLVSMLLFEDYDRLIKFLGNNTILERTRKMIEADKDKILAKKEEYKKKIVINREAFFKTWNIDMRIEEESNTLSEEYNSIYANPKYHYQKHYTSSPYLNVWNKVASYINNEEKVIDVGCGPGQFMELLKDRGVKSYLGYDFSRTALEIARSKNLSPDYKVEYLDLYKMKPLPEADVYTLIEVLEHIKPDREVIDLIPGGKIIITVPNYLGGSHVRKFDTEEAVLERYIDLLKIKEITTINYGTGKIFVLFGIK